MSDTKTVEGTVAGITEKPSGWTRIEVAVPGKQYPVKLDTKDEDIINAARETKGQIATFTYDEWDSQNKNPNTGDPYKERRPTKIELGSSSPAAPEPHHDPIHFADKDRAISRMACLKSAAAIVAADIGEHEDPGKAVMATAQRFEQWIYRDIDPAPFE